MKQILTVALASAMLMAAFAGCGAPSGGAAGSDFDASYPISVVSREPGSGTRGAFIELFGIELKGADGSRTDTTTEEAIIANKTDVMMTNVAGDAYAIGYASLGSLNDSVKALKIDGAAATAENVKSGAYKIARPFNIAVGDGAGAAAQDFVGFIMSAEGQQVVEDSGYIKKDAAAAPYAGGRPEGKIVVAGSSSVSPVMEKLKEAYASVNPSASIEIQTSDSTAGMTAAMDGACDIGMASRELKESEAAGLNATAIAIDGIAVIVAPQNPSEDLSGEQVKAIFTGASTAWNDVVK